MNRRLALTIGVAACLAACGPTNLRGAWTVESVGSTDVSDDGILLRLMDDDQAELDLRCGMVNVVWVQDTDGEHMVFGTELVPGTCKGAVGHDQLVLDALLAADTWSAQGTDRLVLDAFECAHRLPAPSDCRGADVVRLKRR